MSATVLIVDDDPITVEQFSQILRMTGYAVVSATDGPEGLRQASHHHLDLLIIDLHLPLMSGADLLEQIRQMPKLRAVPAVIVTGNYALDDEVGARLQALGAEVKFKPLWVDELVDIVTRLLPGELPKRR